MESTLGPAILLGIWAGICVMDMVGPQFMLWRPLISGGGAPGAPRRPAGLEPGVHAQHVLDPPAGRGRGARRSQGGGTHPPGCVWHVVDRLLPDRLPPG